MRTLTLRKAALAAVVPLALGSLAACGGNDSSQTAADTAASSATPDATQTPDTSTSPAPAVQTVAPTAFLAKMKTAATSVTTAKFTMSMDLGGQAVDAKGALDLTGDRPAMELSMDLTGMGTPTDMRLVGGNMYIQAPGSDGKYVKVDLSDPNGPMAGMGDALTNYDPQSMISSMSADAFKKVTDLGPETVGGQQVRHYRVLLDTKAATSMLKNLPSTASMPKSMDYDLWLDSQDRIARFKMLMKNVTSVTATYSDYGADVHIAPPSPADIIAMPGTAG
jgi:hypothetical protein